MIPYRLKALKVHQGIFSEKGFCHHSLMSTVTMVPSVQCSPTTAICQLL